MYLFLLVSFPVFTSSQSQIQMLINHILYTVLTWKEMQMWLKSDPPNLPREAACCHSAEAFEDA